MSEPVKPPTVPSVHDIVMRWIPISERLPGKDEYVLFYWHGEREGEWSEVQLGWYEGHQTMGEAIVMETNHDDPSWWFPCTHWMPLPDAPKST